FVDFLILLGVAFPPIAGIMTAEYFVVKRWRGELESTRDSGAPPTTAPTWVPVTLVIWVAAALIGKYWEWGLPSVNSLVIAFGAYVIAGRLGLVRGIGVTREKDTEEALVDETAGVRRPSRERP